MNSTARHLCLAVLLAMLSRESTAADLVLLGGRFEAQGRSEAADWDTGDGFGQTAAALPGGAWDGDTTCPPGACLDVSSGVVTEGGSASTRATADLVTLGGGESSFSSLTLTLGAQSSADVSEVGILSDASTTGSGGLALIVARDTSVLLLGRCSGEVTGATASAFCAAAVLDGDAELVGGGGALCEAPGPCDGPVTGLFRMRAFQPYLLLAGTRAETSTELTGSARVQLDLVMITLPEPAR